MCIRDRLKLGSTRIAITAQKPGHRTERERLRIERRKPPPVTTPAEQGGSAEQQQSGCPPGEQRESHMDQTFCVPPTPTSCPPGQTPVRATQSCEPDPLAQPEAPNDTQPHPNSDEGKGDDECVPGYHYTNEPPGGCVPD